jgi:hypothetical protein
LVLLRALALGQEYKDKKSRNIAESDPEMANLRAQILNDVKFVFDHRPEWAPLNEFFWNPPRNIPINDRDVDLADVYNFNPGKENELRAYVDAKVKAQLR